MKKLVIISCHTYDYTKTHKEKPTGVSKTIENETMSIQDIIKRQAAGLVNYETHSVYIDAELEQIDKFHGQPLDLTDLDELQARISDLTQFVEHSRLELEKDREEFEKGREEPENGLGDDVGVDDNPKGDEQTK